MTIALRVNADNLYHKFFKNGAKVVSKYNFDYHNYNIILKFFDIKNVIAVQATDEKKIKDFDEYYFYFTKDEVIKMIKEKIKIIINDNFYNGK